MAALKRNSRLGGGETIKEVLRSGQRFGRDGLTVYIRQSKNLNTRVAVVVPKKTDKRAVKRNKLRRQIGEIMRPIIPRTARPSDVVIYAGPRTALLDFKQLEEILIGLFKKFLKN